QDAMCRMLAMIRHRGPDGFGIYIDDRVGLGSARLSIIDLTGGDQPICNEDGTLWIVFNGEIFNYVEIRPLLEARGHRFSTHSDTEVILHLYEDYGPECLKYLNGQFAIAIWDSQRQSLFLARDRLGIRPLFYTQYKGQLLFASEIKSILAYSQTSPEIDPVSLDEIFTFWSTLSPRTIFKNIYDVPPAHYLLVQDGQLQVCPYWELDFSSQVDPLSSEQEYLDQFEELLVDATRIRLRADVPVGAYLSGGLDSSTIAAIVRNYTSNQLDTFSISFSDLDFDESSFQQRMARFLGTQHQVVFTEHADIGHIFPEVIWHTETPILRTAPAPMFLLSELVRKNHYKVVLTGEGADEFLAGYDIFKEAKIRRFWAREKDSSWRSLLIKRLYPDISALPNSSAYLASFFGEGLADVDLPNYSHAIRWRTTRRARRFFSEDLQREVDDSSYAFADSIPYPDGFMRWHPLSRAQWLEVTTFLSQYLLSSQGDRPAMAHSVEGRFPFLDYRMVEFCNRLPSHLKLFGLKEKYLLKKLARKWLPEEIWQRRKRPYRAPIYRSFFSSQIPAWVNELLSPESIRQNGLFKPEAVNQLVIKLKAGKPLGETDDMALAGILSSQLVYQQFITDFRLSPSINKQEFNKIYDYQTVR
ncbi:MAG TPA: asparagine synthase (glutamine-hydrolyzing), partial [Anaerolineales bacterium]|nr:asparagine synthase (glutamine-hydrolyzing) [Anaerolineales bacterium]